MGWRGPAWSARLVADLALVAEHRPPRIDVAEHRQRRAPARSGLPGVESAQPPVDGAASAVASGSANVPDDRGSSTRAQRDRRRRGEAANSGDADAAMNENQARSSGTYLVLL